MCGLAGFLGSFGDAWLEAAGGMLSHRGPDDAGTWIAPDRSCGLAHRRLSIIDLSPTGHQPMVDPASGMALTYNGEIYNYRDLRRELEGRGHRFVGQSDSEVLLKGLVEYGEAVLPRLDGIFAFAAYDPRRRRLLIARDPFGIKPLYYARAPGGLLFASELKALLLERSVPRELDADAIGAYLTFLWSPGERTPLKSVRKLLPGHVMIAESGQLRTVRYAAGMVGAPPHGDDPSSLARELDARLADAVERQMVADVPVGAFLSGGLDSSAIVAHAARLAGGRNLQCFTIAADHEQLREEGVADDLPYARLVAEKLGVPLNVVRVDDSLVERLPEALFHLDEPQADPAVLNVLLIAELARARNIKVLLSGTAGDDLFSGYRRHLALRAEALWSWLPVGVRATLGRGTRGLAGRSGRLRKLARAFEYAPLDDDGRLLSYFFWLEPQLGAALLDRRLGASAQSIVAPMSEALAASAGHGSRLERMLALEQRFFLPDHNLNYTDKLAMARGVEVRVPFLDPQVVGFAAGLPSGLKIRGTQAKWLLKRAMEAHLPREVIYRPKTGFGAPLRRWLRTGLRPWVDEVLAPAALRSRGLFEPQRVAELVARNRAGQADASYPIFAIVCVELWCRMFVDPAVPTRL